MFPKVEPKDWGGIEVRVFKTNDYLYVSGGILTAKSVPIEANKVLDAPPTDIFKPDLKVTSPASGAKIAKKRFELKWAPYAGAASYGFSLHADDPAKSQGYFNVAVDSASFTLDKPLADGAYTLDVVAHNAWGTKIAGTKNAVKFSVAAK